MKNSSVLSIFLLLSLPTTGLFSMDIAIDTPTDSDEESKELLARGNRLVDEAIKQKERQKDYTNEQSQVPPAAAQARTSLPATNDPEPAPKSAFLPSHFGGIPAFTHSPGCRHAGTPPPPEIAHMLQLAKDTLEQVAEPYKVLKRHVDNADRRLHTVLATYLTLAKEDQAAKERPSVDPVSLAKFAKEKAEFVNAGDSLYECLGNPHLKEFMKSYYMGHPATNRFITAVDRAESQLVNIDLPRESQLRLADEIMALRKGLHAVKAKDMVEKGYSSAHQH